MAVIRLLLLAVLSAVSGVSGTDGDSVSWPFPWPWRKWCLDRSAATYNLCPTWTRSHLPTVDPTGRFEITWCRRIVGAEGIEGKILTASKMWHTGIRVKELGLFKSMDMLLEYEAINFDPSIFFPQITPNGTLNWNNTAIAGWKTDFNTSEWTTQVKMGDVNGTVLNKWFDWIPAWQANHTKYILFSAWDEGGFIPALRHTLQAVPDSLCHTFTEDSLVQLHTVGADFSAVQEPLCRNYFPFIKPLIFPAKKIDASDPAEFKEVVTFYRELAYLVHNETSLDGFTHDLVNFLTKFKGSAYIPTNDQHTYYIIPLTWPHFVPVRQRMVLPWQDHAAMHAPWECYVSGKRPFADDMSQLHFEEVPLLV